MKENTLKKIKFLITCNKKVRCKYVNFFYLSFLSPPSLFENKKPNFNPSLYQFSTLLDPKYNTSYVACNSVNNMRCWSRVYNFHQYLLFLSSFLYPNSSPALLVSVMRKIDDEASRR